MASTAIERCDTGFLTRRSASFSRPIDERFLFLPRFSHWESRYSELDQRRKAGTNRREGEGRANPSTRHFTRIVGKKAISSNNLDTANSARARGSPRD